MSTATFPLSGTNTITFSQTNPEISNENKALEIMRKPFEAHQISKMCRPTKRDNQPGRCKDCGGWHKIPSVQLSYVGHAALTDRLLDADPTWTWEPLAFAPNGTPLLDNDGGMWIKLTVAGVTRLGYGDAQGKTGGDATKERIGDALRNAAMRFGAALELWHRGDLHAAIESEDEKPSTSGQEKYTGPKTSNSTKHARPATSKTSDVGDTAEREQNQAGSVGSRLANDLRESSAQAKAETSETIATDADIPSNISDKPSDEEYKDYLKRLKEHIKTTGSDKMKKFIAEYTGNPEIKTGSLKKREWVEILAKLDPAAQEGKLLEIVK